MNKSNKCNIDIWIKKNHNIINIIIDRILNILDNNKNKYNYTINYNNIVTELIYYLYDTSDNKYNNNIY